MKVITSESSIVDCQTALFKELDIIPNSTIPCKISWRSEPFEAEVCWSEELSMWWFSRRFEDRWLNFFGVNKPLERDKVKISSELNTPVQGINRGVAVCFVTNGKKTYLAHRGNRWGSGKRGLDKNYFWDKFEGHHEIVEDDGLLSKVAIICTLGEAHLPRDLSSFVHWIVGIKSSQMIV